VYADISSRNLKHLQKHLTEFRHLDPSLVLTDVLVLGQRIASRPENLFGIPGGRQVFEEVVTIGGKQVRVRVVLNPSGALRSVHLRL
jgi:hypothetical protein